ncbi:hypothetical protein [Streptomyces sp. NPDC005805]|uniref:hypothetical protein n=1 Tax=Streptomyces sp. NPDC005805 TaxID=3157068 RepID=UPI0033EFFA85
MPEKFCGVSVNEAVLSPLLPGGGEVTVREDGAPDPGLMCDVLVDGNRVLDATVREVDAPLPPEDWDTALSLYSKAERRAVPFSGAAVIGADGARVEARCDNSANSEFLLINVGLQGDHVEKSEEAVADVERFLNDFVSGMTRKLGCTS